MPHRLHGRARVLHELARKIGEGFDWPTDLLTERNSQVYFRGQKMRRMIKDKAREYKARARHAPAISGLAFALLLSACGETGGSAGLQAAGAGAAASAPPPRPNVVYILADDLGYGDLGAYGQAHIDTPNLDRLAAEGLLFTQHYAGSTVCAPSRASLMTGQHTGRVQIRGNYELGGFRDEEERGQMAIDFAYETLPEVLRGAGYRTGLVGKWGLGGPGSAGVPNKHGFDYFFGYLDQKQAHNYYPTHLWRNDERVALDNRFFIPHAEMAGTSDRAEDYRQYIGEDYAPDRLIEEALGYIERAKDAPFFLYYAPTIPHSALQVPDAELEPYEGRWTETPLDDGGYTPHPKPRAARAAMISRLDADVGKILRRLERLGLAENTLVVFTSDNGPAPEGGQDVGFFNSSGGLRGVKRDLHEGGIRVPMIAYWPSVIEAGRSSDHVSAQWDVLPTLAELAGAETPEGIDGISFAPLLTGRGEQPAHAYLYWEFHGRQPHPAQAVRRGDWKALRPQPQGYDPGAAIELYDLASDPAESRNVAAEHPAVVAEMRTILNDARTRSPYAGFNFDPDATPPLAAAAVNETKSERRRRLFTDDWSFALGDVEGAAEPGFDDGGWRVLDLPHDWSIEGDYAEDHPAGAPGAFLPGGVGWYRKQIDYDPGWADKAVRLTFDGVYMNARVYVNGEEHAYQPYGYIGFSLDLTDLLREGENTIAVRVDNSKLPSGRWYTGSGIYRDVWLTVTGPVHVREHGSFVRGVDVGRERATVLATHEVVNAQDAPIDATATLRLLDVDGVEVARNESRVTLAAGDTTSVDQQLDVTAPRLWSPDAPSLYTAVFTLADSRGPLDRYETVTGLRSIEFTVDRGFLLNGEPLELEGVCLHHDGGPVGAAVPEDVWRHRLELLKDMGANALRTAHNPFAPEFYRLADEMGFLVMNEAFDGWETPKAPYDYGLYFEDWWQKDLDAFVRRDRNHPSVILWSVGNEVRDATAETQKKLVDRIRSLDTTRPITQGRGYSYPHADIAGFNGHGEFVGAIEKFHAENPERVVVGTEITHSLHTRGVYRSKTEYRTRDNPAPWELNNPNRTAAEIWERIKSRVYPVPDLSATEVWPEEPLEYASSFDNNLVRMPIREEIRLARELPYLIGTFRWTAFDYLGESRGWPARTMNFGIIDLAGFPKGPYHLYRSQWSALPMVHVDPHWTHPGKEGVGIPVVVYTNLDRAELFLNGDSLGEKPMTDAMQIVWTVPYTPGELRVVARGKNGVTRTAIRRTAAEPAALRVVSDRGGMPADGRAVARIEVDVVDAKGTLVPQAGNRLHFDVRGPGRLIGVENGDILDLDSTKADSRRAFRGKALALVQSTGAPGSIRVAVGSDGLPTRTVDIDAYTEPADLPSARRSNSPNVVPIATADQAYTDADPNVVSIVTADQGYTDGDPNDVLIVTDDQGYTDVNPNVVSIVTADQAYTDIDPNVVLIVTDDLGYADVGFNGGTEIPTPNIDRVATEGVTFTRGYVSHSICAPSRAGLMTGRYQSRFGFDRNPNNDPADPLGGLPLSETTIAEALKSAGYATMAVGKWHLGTHPDLRPRQRGFDEFFGFLTGGHRYFPEELTLDDLSDAEMHLDWYRTRLRHNGRAVDIDGYLTDELSDKAVDFIRRRSGGPFFLYLSYNAPHSPLQATEKYLQRFAHVADEKRRAYAAMVSAVDDGVGRVLDTLDDEGIADDTLVVFLSDNGGTGFASRNTPLRGRKRTLFEGGLRVPFALRWPAVIEAGREYSQPVISLDIMATVAARTGAAISTEHPLDGVDLVPFLTGRKLGPPHEALYWRRFDTGEAAILRGDTKAIWTPDERLLFDLGQDPAETRNLAGANGELVAALRAEHRRWDEQMLEPVFPPLRTWLPLTEKQQRNRPR